MPQRYFDHHSSTPLHPRARQALIEALDIVGDPSKLHAAGRAVRAALEDAREAIAHTLSVQPEQIVFTAGGTGSVMLAILEACAAREHAGRRVLIGAIEHPSVQRAARLLLQRDFEVVAVPVDESGRLDVDRFVMEVRRPGTILASIQHANHEVGTMQPIAEVARLARDAGVLFHTDACQTVGRLPIEPEAIGAHLLSLSAHKFGGPPGVGALYVGGGVVLGATEGAHERTRQAGTENVPGVVAMAAALDASVAEIADQAARQWALTTRLRGELAEHVAGARLHGHPTQRVPHLVCFSVDAVDPEVLLMALDHRGFRLDAGSVSAPSAHQPSPVLQAMGAPDTVAFRAGVGPETTEDDVDALVESLSELVRELSRMRA